MVSIVSKSPGLAPGFSSTYNDRNGISDMAKTKAIKSKVTKDRGSKEQQLSIVDAKRQRMLKLRTWAFIIWVIGIMLILAKWGKFGGTY